MQLDDTNGSAIAGEVSLECEHCDYHTDLNIDEKLKYDDNAHAAMYCPMCGKNRYVKADEIGGPQPVPAWSIADLCDNLNVLTGRFGDDSKLYIIEQSEVGSAVGRFNFKLYTYRTEYIIRAHEAVEGDAVSESSLSYLGCQLSGRKPLPGVEGTGGRDLSDGRLCEETWRRILRDIIAWELLPIAKEETGAPGPSVGKEVPEPNNGPGRNESNGE